MTLIKALRPYLNERAYRILVAPPGGSSHGGGFTTVEQVAAATDEALLDLRNMGPVMLASVREALREVTDLPALVHEPRRDSDVAAWIKAHRDQHSEAFERRAEWHAINDMLDDYRKHADFGVPLNEEIGVPNA